MNWMIKLLFLLSIIYGNTFYFLQFQLNIHRFKCIARFGLAHIVATNLCVWIRTVVKECTKEIALYRVNRGHGVSEDYMILGMYKYLVRASSVLFCPKLLNLILYWSRNKIAIKKKINDNQDWIVCLLYWLPIIWYCVFRKVHLLYISIFNMRPYNGSLAKVQSTYT